MDFTQNRQVNKSADEIEFDSLCAVYAQTFGVQYRIAYGVDGMTLPEMLADIRRRIAAVEPQPAPEYERGADY